MTDILGEILKRIKNAKEATIETVSTGHNIEDYSKYQRILGEIAGLQTALEIIDEVLTEDDEQE
jgi:hypothetical protein